MVAHGSPCRKELRLSLACLFVLQQQQLQGYSFRGYLFRRKKADRAMRLLENNTLLPRLLVP